MDDIEIEGRNYDLSTIKQFQLQIEHNVKDPSSQSKITYALHTLLTIFVLAKMARRYWLPAYIYILEFKRSETSIFDLWIGRRSSYTSNH